MSAAAFRAETAAQWCGGALLRGDAAAQLCGVETDTRRPLDGKLFVAIRGPHHDAHAFLDAALSAGAAGLLVQRGAALPARAGVPVIAVDDTTAALGALAKGHRAEFNGPVVAITGSNGKTSTKEMCAAILSRCGPTLKTPGNLNNAYGLPLSLLARQPGHRAMVVEIGMNQRGEIAQLAEIAAPTVGVITNVGSAHIGQLGSLAEIALEKGDLVAGLPETASAVLNAGDPRAAAQAGRCRARVLRFGLDSDAPLSVCARKVRACAGRFVFEMQIGAELRPARDAAAPGDWLPVSVTGLAAEAVENALAAATAALAAGAAPEQVQQGLADYAPPAGRMAPLALPGGAHCIDDSYNANPQSTAAALRALARVKGGGRGIFVLGDMGELGDCAAAAHRSAGELAAALKLDGFFALGRFAETAAAAARAAGMAATAARACGSHAEAAAHAGRGLAAGDWVLVKGSRAMRMERVVEALRGEAD